MDRSTFYVSTNADFGMPLMVMRQEKFWKNPLTKMGLQKIDFFHIWAIKTMEDYAAYMKKAAFTKA
ncbi:MAG: hypothetical protein ACLSCV_00540 [Acutalibacteraceae bacterium]